MKLQLPFISALALAGVLCGLAAAGGAQAQTLSGDDLAAALKDGGLVVVMRHAASPRERPDEATANPDNPERERQLDQAGLDAAEAMGVAIDALAIPVGAVYSSPTYRALQTVRAADLGDPEVVDELDLPGGMAADPAALESRAAWLRAKAAEPPAPGANMFLVTHGPNLAAAFGIDAEEIADGEALVFRPDGSGGTALVARLAIENWPALAGAN
jgi:phosphohistidine phosphatase SixA